MIQTIALCVIAVSLLVIAACLCTATFLIYRDAYSIVVALSQLTKRLRQIGDKVENGNFIREDILRRFEDLTDPNAHTNTPLLQVGLHPDVVIRLFECVYGASVETDRAYERFMR